MILFSCVLALAACSKDDESLPAPSGGGGTQQVITAPPSSFTQKALLEYHTAAWCGSCPDAATKRDQVMAAYPNRVIPVAIHQSDSMQISGFFTLSGTFGANPAYGMVNRTPSLNNVLLNRTQWLTNVSSALSRTPASGMAILSVVTGNTAVIEVQGAFLSGQTGNYNLTVWLTEMDVTGTGTGFDQVNSYNNDPSSQWYNLGNPISGYKHQYVWRKSVTPVMGDPIPGTTLVEGGLVKKIYNADISGLKKDKTYVVAFINKIGTSATTHEVVNVQMAKLGDLVNWN